MASKPAVMLYELNEVPWSIVDLYIERNPGSAFAALLTRGRTYTTVNEDPAHLSPWRTWPTLHRSMYVADHGAYDLGQDPSTFRGTDLWTVLDEAGHSVGLFGPLQSWPPRRFASGGFHVPDTFAADPTTIPADLEAFQAFNLKMTAENSFSSDAALSGRLLARAGFDMLRLGLTPRSAFELARHLTREVREPRWKAARAMMQVVPSFDLYRRLHDRYDPALSIFFTNHVAAMMHRFWGDAVPEYAADFDYEVDSVYRNFVFAAMDLTDRHLRRLMQVVDRRGGRLVVAASMGQGPVPHHPEQVEMLHLEDPAKLVAFLGCGEATPRLAMYPMCSLEFGTTAEAERAADRMEKIVDSSEEFVFSALERRGRTVTFHLTKWMLSPDDARTVRVPEGPDEVPYEALGLVIGERLGGDNTAYHIPEGILVDYGSPGPGGDHRTRVDVLDVAPSLLENLFDVPAAPDMRGRADRTLFARAA